MQKFFCVSMSQCERENVIISWRICKWTPADNTNINVNNICLIFKRLNELKGNAFLKE